MLPYQVKEEEEMNDWLITPLIITTSFNLFALWNFFLCASGLWFSVPNDNKNTTVIMHCRDQHANEALLDWLYVSSVSTAVAVLIVLALYNATHWPTLERERDNKARSAARRCTYRLPFLTVFLFYLGRSLLLLYRALPLLVLCTLDLNTPLSMGPVPSVALLQCVTFALAPFLLLVYTVSQLNTCYY